MKNLDRAKAGCDAISRRQMLRGAATVGAAPALIAFAPAGSGLGNPDTAWASGSPAGLEAWMHQRLDEADQAVAQLRAARGARTIANTLLHYDRARNALAMAVNNAQVLGSAGATPGIQTTARRFMDEVGAASVRLDLDPAVHAALRELSATSEARRADPATRHYIAQAILRGRLAGADRDDLTRARVQRIQSRIAEFGATYMANMQRSTVPLRATVDELKGLPADFVARLPSATDGTVALAITQMNLQPVLRFSDDPALRRRMYLAYENLAFPTNAPVLAELVSARAELARELGFASYADYTLADQMLTSADSVQALLDRIDALSQPIATRNAAEVIKFARTVDPSATVTAADATYWSERYGRERFDIDSQALRAYLPFAQVRSGIMDFAASLFGVRFSSVPASSAWHPHVAVFDVHDASPSARGGGLGRIYVDAHPRAGKDQVFATAPLVPGIRGRQRPEAVILCNLPGGDPDDPGLLSHGDVVNFLHEFGHLMHFVLAGQGQWAGQGAYDTEEDFLEAPSQMLEEFSRDASVLRRFARHYETGEPLPTEMIDKLERSVMFTRAGWIRSQLQRARLALAVHRAPQTAESIEAAHVSYARASFGYEPVAGTHGYAASPHLFQYGPNYYMYLLDKVVAVDLASRFPLVSPMAGSTAAAYRRQVLEPGAGRPANELIRDFLGRDQRLDALAGWMDGHSGRR